MWVGTGAPDPCDIIQAFSPIFDICSCPPPRGGRGLPVSVSRYRFPAGSSLLALWFLAAALVSPVFGQDSRRLIGVPPPPGATGPEVTLYEGGLYQSSHAFLAGMSDYKGDPWGPLPSVPAEMAELANALRALGFQVELVADLSGDELHAAVRSFIQRNGHPGHRLLFFFAGHGWTLAEGRQGYFVPTDAPDPKTDETGFRASALSMDQVATWAKGINARHVMFVFDSCFAGSVFGTRSRPLPPDWPDLAKPARFFLTAGTATQEVPAYSVFTPTFVRGLRGEADLDGDGFVTGTELGNYVQREVIAYRKGQTPQYGQLLEPTLNEGDVVFAVPDRSSHLARVARQVTVQPSLVPLPNAQTCHPLIAGIGPARDLTLQVMLAPGEEAVGFLVEGRVYRPGGSGLLLPVRPDQRYVRMTCVVTPTASDRVLRRGSEVQLLLR